MTERGKRNTLEYLEECRAKGKERTTVMLTKAEIEYLVGLVNADVFGEKP